MYCTLCTGSHALFFASSAPRLLSYTANLRVCPRCPSCHRSCLTLPECCLECLCEGVLSCPLDSTVLFRACESVDTLYMYSSPTNELKPPLHKTCTTAEVHRVHRGYTHKARLPPPRGSGAGWGRHVEGAPSPRAASQCASNRIKPYTSCGFHHVLNVTYTRWADTHTHSHIQIQCTDSLGPS